MAVSAVFLVAIGVPLIALAACTTAHFPTLWISCGRADGYGTGYLLDPCRLEPALGRPV